MKKTVLFISALVLIFIISLSSCHHGWKSYTVKAGNHSSNGISFPLLNVDKISFDFKANSTWYYPEPLDVGWSKIRGISHGHHQKNSSARLGYKCLDNTYLAIGAYCYVNGESPQQNTNLKKTLDTIQPGIVYHCTISRENDKYVIEFEDKRWECPAGKDKNWGYILKPYIGGEFVLNHDWYVEIKDN